MLTRSPRPPKGPPKSQSHSERVERILADHAVDNATAEIVASAYRRARESEATWPDLLAVDAVVAAASADYATVAQTTDIVRAGVLVDELRERLEQAPIPPSAPRLAAAVDVLVGHLRVLRDELAEGPPDEERWWPTDGVPPIPDAILDCRAAATEALRWYRMARRSTPTLEPKVKVIMRSRVSVDCCEADDCDHDRCLRPGDIGEVAISEAVELCGLVPCFACDETGRHKAFVDGKVTDIPCANCAGRGQSRRAATPFDDEVEQAIAEYREPLPWRRGTHSSFATMSALRTAEFQAGMSRTRPRESAVDDEDRRIRCAENELPLVVAAILHRAGLGSEDGRTRSFDALKKRVTKVYAERILAPRAINDANALRRVSRRTKSET